MKRIFTTFFALFVVCSLFAQVEIVKSTEKVNINGKIYYVHKVQPKQTIYSLCKAYDLGSEELIAANPSLADGLKAGAILYIPSNEKPLVETQSSKDEDFEEEEDDVIVQNNEIKHIVKWYENIFILAAKYNVSVDDIAAYNKLHSKLLKIGQEILIPNVNLVQASDISTEEDLEEDVEEVEEEPVIIDPTTAAHQIQLLSAVPHFSAVNPLKVSLLLSLNSQSQNPSANYYDLYSGALMAIEEMKELGLSVNLKVIDVTNQSIFQNISSDVSILGSDIVIGPAEVAKLTDVAATCRSKSIPFVSLMDQKAEPLVEDNPFFFQMPTTQAKQLENWINTINSNEAITLIYNEDNSEKELVNSIKELLSQKGISTHDVKYNILEGRTIIDSMKTRFKTTTGNTVIIASEVEAFTSDAVRNLWLLKLGGYPMNVYCSNKVRNFETIDEETLYAVNAKFSTQYFVDYGSDETKDFILKYRAMFHAEPSSYSFHGYDSFKFFLSAFKDLGSEGFMDYIPFYKMNLMQTDVQFEKVSETGGYINIETRDVTFRDDLTIDIK